MAKPPAEANRSVCVTGLARAGTTALMRALHGSGHFASLTYADMPFVLAPNLWHRASRGDQRTRRRRQRAHKGGVEVDYDSPEAFEEVFWQLELGDYPSKAGALTAQTVPPAVVASFHAYQQLVCRRYSAERYLAKNNNQILRLASLAPQTPTAMYLIVFRDPLAQAQSLLNQHRRSSNADRFTRQYMQWLGHFEFGATHRPTQLSGGPPSAGGGPSPSPDSVDYWLAQWLDVYGYVETLRGQGLDNVRLVAYERLCDDPQAWPRLCELVGIRATDSPFRHRVSGAETTAADPRLLDEARALYALLDGYSDASPSAV